VDALPVVALRLLDGRVGSTLLMQLLATSDEVVLERSYPEGERRYLSYCLRVTGWVATPWDPQVHPGVTELLFGPPDLGGPIPFTPTLLDVGRLGGSMLNALWVTVSDELRRSTPSARYYAEKLVGDDQLLMEAGIPLRILDVVRDPRDVWCSVRAFSKGEAGFGRRDGESDAQFLETMVARHFRRLRTMAATPPDVDRVLVRYEDLVEDLPRIASNLGSWLGLRLDAERVIAARESYRHHMTSGTTAESVGRWRRELRADWSHRLWEVLGPELEPLGYTAD
jgi:hypothetical protein